jgi:ABC-type long-subunit fatty acid transport system fused permease/ATPase subunit
MFRIFRLVRRTANPAHEEFVMNKIVSGMMLLLTALPVLADEEAVVAAVPKVEADPTGLILFALVFVGMIGAYAFVIWRGERKKKNLSK